VTRPPFEVADIIRQHGDRFIETHGAWLTTQHRWVLRALARCRTAALGGHLDRCVGCDHRAISYNSCRNRHCPKCLTSARDQWLAARQDELLPVGYHHVVFTLPHELSWLALQNKQLVYDLLFRASAATLLEIAADPHHLGAAIGFLSVLHTWGQNLLHHPHVHCVVPVGGLSPDGTRWVQPRARFFLPVKVLSRVFRGKFVAGLTRAFRCGTIALPGRLTRLAEAAAFRAYLRSLFRHDWVVYAKPPFGGPEHVLHVIPDPSPHAGGVLAASPTTTEARRQRRHQARDDDRWHIVVPPRGTIRQSVRSIERRSVDSNPITRPRPPHPPAASFKRLYRE
jgi:hypothetical protein